MNWLFLLLLFVFQFLGTLSSGLLIYFTSEYFWLTFVSISIASILALCSLIFLVSSTINWKTNGKIRMARINFVSIIHFSRITFFIYSNIKSPDDGLEPWNSCRSVPFTLRVKQNEDKMKKREEKQKMNFKALEFVISWRRVYIEFYIRTTALDSGHLSIIPDRSV